MAFRKSPIYITQTQGSLSNFHLLHKKEEARKGWKMAFQENPLLLDLRRVEEWQINMYLYPSYYKWVPTVVRVP